MTTQINSNLYSNNAIRLLSRSEAEQSQSMQRLASGKFINHANDNAAGLAVVTRMTSQLDGNAQAIANLNDGFSVTQTINGGLDEVLNLYQRMRELAIQSLNGTYTDDTRQQMDLEFQALYTEIGRIASETKFNGVSLFLEDGTIQIQAGWENQENNKIGIRTLDIMNLDITVEPPPPPPPTFDALKLDAPQGFDGVLVLGDTYQVNIMGIETVTITYGNIPLMDLLGLAITAPTGSTANQFLTNIINNDASLQAAGLSASFNGGDGSITIESDNQDIGTGDISMNVMVDVGAPLSFGKTVLPAPPPPDPPDPTADALSIKTTEEATQSIGNIDARLEQLTSYTAEVGATYKRMSHTISNLIMENQSMHQARSQIEDADYAQEMAKLTKGKILQEAGMAMLSHSREMPEKLISSLLR